MFTCTEKTSAVIFVKDIYILKSSESNRWETEMIFLCRIIVDKSPLPDPDYLYWKTV